MKSFLRKHKTTIIAIMICPLIVISLYWGLLYFQQTRIMYPGHYFEATESPELPPEVIKHFIETEEGPVEGWFIPAHRFHVHALAPDIASTQPQSEAGPALKPAPLMIYFHGNATTIDRMYPFLMIYPEHQINLLLVEYRGYNRSAGTPSKENFVKDAIAFKQWAMKQPGVDPQRVIYVGHSMGGAIATAFHAEDPADLLILWSTFSSTDSMAFSMGVPGLLIRDRYNTAEILRNTDTPVILIHGADDEIIPLNEAKINHEASKHSILHTYPGTHNDIGVKLSSDDHPFQYIVNQLLERGWAR